MKTMNADDETCKENNSFYKTCECGRSYTVKATFYRHKKVCSVTINSKKTGNFVCQEDHCSFRAKVSKEFLHHLKNKHNIATIETIHHFQSYKDFEMWKVQYEKETVSAFLLRSKMQTSNGRVEYYYCNRSGILQTKSNYKRAEKSQGLKKIGFNCPASVRAELDISHNHIEVRIQPLHYRHNNQLCHLPLPGNDRVVIAKQLSLGIQPAHVIRNFFSGENTQLERKHLCTKQDVRNISKCFRIEKIEKHPNDHTSVDIYVMKNLENNIILYKRQDDDCLSFPKEEKCTLGKEDFAIGIMTDFQRQMLKTFGGNIICVDSTHGTNKYDFNLITVLVVDNFREGVPVAWLISNRENSIVLKLFFELIRKQVDDIHPRIFMSDKAPQYFNTWTEIFPSHTTKKLLCHWHVHNDWQKQLCKVKDHNIAATVYKALCLLLEATDTSKFEVLLSKCLEQMFSSSVTEDFGKYFTTEWVPVKEEWAKCFRLGSGINTNMFLESFHKTLKYSEDYFARKQVKRVDKCFYTLLQFSQDLVYKHLIKVEKGKTTWKVADINKRHMSSLNIPLNTVTKVSETIFNVVSTDEKNKSDYQVKKNVECTNDCKIKCKHCNICLHSYQCNCLDGHTATNICKHMHLIARYNTSGPFPVEKEDKHHKNVSNNTYKALQNVPSTTEGFNVCYDPPFLLKAINPERDNIDSIKQNLLDKCMKLHEQIKQCTDRNTLLTAKEHVTSALSMLEVSETTDCSVLKCDKLAIPHNKHIQKQRRFFSTKKQRETKKSRYTKPTLDEKRKVEQILNGLSTEIRDDHSYSVSSNNCTKKLKQ